MTCNNQQPTFTVGIDGKGRLICQEENLEPSVTKILANIFLDIEAKFCLNFTLPANASDQPISFGAITDAKFLFVYTHNAIELKINSLGSSPIPCCPYMLLLADAAGITELYLTNLGTATSVQVVVGA